MSAELAVLTQLKNKSSSYIGEIREFSTNVNPLNIGNEVWIKDGSYYTSSDPLAKTISLSNFRLPTSVANTLVSFYSIAKNTNTGRLVAVGSTGACRYSDNNGESWTSVTLPFSSTYFEIVYGNGLFVTINNSAGASTSVYTSPDGITWTARTTGALAHNSITFAGGMFIIGVEATSTSNLYTSLDGVTWTSRTNYSGSTYCRKVQFIPETNEVFSYTNLGINKLLISSTTVVSATAGSQSVTLGGGSGSGHDSILHFNGKTLAITYTSSSLRIYRSPDEGSTVWYEVPLPFSVINAFGSWNVASAYVVNGLLIIASASSNVPPIATTDLKNWFSLSNYAEAPLLFMDMIEANNGNLVFVGSSGGTTSRVSIASQISGFSLNTGNQNSYMRVL